MEKEEYKAQLDAACEKFRKLMADQLTRVEDMKAQGDFVDYNALDCIKIGVCGGDGIGPIISAQARRMLEFVLSDLKEGGRVEFKTILRMSVPVTLLSLLIPLSSLIDSVLAVRLLGKYEADAVTLYGLFAGGAVTIIGLPVSVCYGIAAASIPRVASEPSGKKARRKIFHSLGLTALLGGVSAIGLYLFAEPAVRIVFRSLTDGEKQTMIRLVQAYSVSALTLSCSQTLAACLTAQGKPQHAALSMLVGVTVKTVCYFFWLKNPEISVFGLAYATNLCYLVAFSMDFVYNLIILKKRIRKENAR